MKVMRKKKYNKKEILTDKNVNEERKARYIYTY